MTDAPRTTEYVDLTTLKADPRNPKAHDIGTLDASVSRFGVVDPIVVDGRTGYIISGHGRTETLLAMRERGDSAPEGVVLSEDGSAWLVPVASGWSSRSDSEAAAALIALNRTTELGGWVDENLLELLDGLSDAEAMDGVGYSDGEMDILRRKLDAAEVFTGEGAGGMIDEWKSISGQDETEYRREYETAVTVYLRDKDAVEEFRTALGLPEGDVGKRVNYPLDWEPNDRRMTWKAERDAAVDPDANEIDLDAEGVIEVDLTGLDLERYDEDDET